jgi:hypothetical protein
MVPIVKKKKDLAFIFEDKLKIPRFYAFVRIFALFFFLLCIFFVIFIATLLSVERLINSQLILFFLALIFIFSWLMRWVQRKGSRFVWWRPWLKD